VIRTDFDEAGAIAEQERLRALVEPTGDLPSDLRLVAGVDVSYAKDADLVAGAVVVLDCSTLEVVDSAIAMRKVDFPYLPGLLAFREIPALLDALDKLKTAPELLVCDGYGLAHPRRFGLACHLGVVTGIPAFGVAKTAFIGTGEPPGPARGDTSDLLDGEEVIGRVLRTQHGVKPVFVSVGHKIDLARATSMTLELTPSYRLPQTTRLADQMSRRALAAGSSL
jgi:deoxyribonuclease V